MGKVIDLTGQKFGRWTVSSFAKSKLMSGRKRLMWNCVCECGVKDIIRGENLKSGATKSCGCLVKDTSTTHGMHLATEYTIWNGMIQRCTNPNNKKYYNYGGRGITVCDSWLKFENFYEDMGDRPEGLSIDRIDNSKGYYKENCRWANAQKQEVNKRPRKDTLTGVRGVYPKRNKFCAKITVDGKTISLGSHFTIEEAKEARRKAELKYFGQYCPTE